MHPARTTSWTPARISAPGQHFRRLAAPHTTALRSADRDDAGRRPPVATGPVRLTGWGRNTSSTATVVTAQPGQDIARSVQDAAGAGLIARGCGRSYGDAALCDGGTVLDMTGLDRILEFDAGSGLLVAEAGATLSQIIAQTHPRGWLPPVMPGTAFVTLGGAVASDVHGKNHVSSGSFGRHVQWLDLLAADLSVVRLSPRMYSEQFWTTVGGMGLTGVILTVCLQLRSAAGSMLRQQQRARSFGAVLESMDRAALRQLSDQQVLHPLLLGTATALTVLAYLAVSLLYSLRLKHVAVLDIVAVATGFVLRSLSGAAASHLQVSNWFLLVSLFGALYLVAGKRRAEASAAAATEVVTRPVLTGYPAEWLDQVVTLALAGTVLSYAMWAFQYLGTDIFRPVLAASFVPFLVALLRYGLLLAQGHGERPERALLHDRMLVGAGCVWMLMVTASLYLA